MRRLQDADALARFPITSSRRKSIGIDFDLQNSKYGIMGNYFTPLRRKIGLLTLAMACLFMGAWVRSWTIRDNMYISRPHALHAFASAGGTLRWGKQMPGFDDDDSPAATFSSRPVLPREDHDYYWHDERMEWRWGFGGFDFGAGISTIVGPTTRMERWAIPYWSIVISLTLISAFLLLSKSSRSTQKTIAEPLHPENGA